MSKRAGAELDDKGLELARELGRQAAEDFDRRLRESETRELEERLTELLWRQRSDGRREATYDVAYLEGRVEELSHHLSAIERSLPWRMAQWLRGLVGRRW